VHPKNRLTFVKMMRDKGYKTILDDGGHDMYIGVRISDALPFLNGYA
jgi:hypothetical protein